MYKYKQVFCLQVLVDKLSDAMITWDQPWYQVTSKLTGNKIENQEGMPKFLLDPLTTDECEHVKKNWDKLVKVSSHSESL